MTWLLGFDFGAGFLSEKGSPVRGFEVDGAAVIGVLDDVGVLILWEGSD